MTLSNKKESLVVEKIKIQFQFYFFPLLGTLGGSLKKIAKKIIPNVPINKNV